MSAPTLSDTQFDLLNTLNDRQKEAVESITGSTLVIAGAGSGKTAVLTRRVAYLISLGEIPGNILCLTFTNKAAAEMNKRVRETLEKIDITLPYTPVWKDDYITVPLLCTFHSLGVRILREFGDKIDLKKEFSILDSDDQKKIIREILKELNVNEKNLQPSLIQYFISQCKQQLLIASDSRRVNKEFLPIFHQVYKRYEQRLKDNQCVDFDDLLLLPYLLIRDNLEVREILHDRWIHVMVDEFQDTNPAQMEIIKLLLSPEMIAEDSKRSLFVVGDDAQSIYGFRGSKIEIILNFEQQYPNCREIILNQNYRSTQPILDLAEKVLTHNPGQKKKDLFTQNPESIRVQYYLARNDRDEAEYIIKQIYKQYTQEDSESSERGDNIETEDEITFQPDTMFDSFDNKISKPTQHFVQKDAISAMFDVYLENEDFRPPSISRYNPQSWQVPTYNWQSLKKLNNCAILYRTHSQSRSIEETLLKYNVPYRLVSGTRFLDRKEIKDVLAILKFLANGDDKLSLVRFLPLVLDGVGPKTIEKILVYLEDYTYPLPPKNQEQILTLISGMQSTWQSHNNLIDLTKDLLSTTGYFRYLKTEYTSKEELEVRLENIGEIYSLMLPFDEDKSTTLSERLNQFLLQVSLMSKLDDDETDSTPKINLMSLHQSKGLEFETVFLVGVEDGLLPHSNSLFEPNGIEEEVRLAYVGVTRAKKYLHLVSAQSRVQFGQVKANSVSRIFRPFLDTYCVRNK